MSFNVDLCNENKQLLKQKQGIFDINNNKKS